MIYQITETQRKQLLAVINGAYGTTAPHELVAVIEMLQALAPVDDSDDLMIAYMAGFHAGKPAPVDAQPVAWAMRRADGLVLDVICPDEHESHEGGYTLPLYAHPVPLRELSDAEPVMFAFKYSDGSWHDASATEHSAGMKPLFAHPAPLRELSDDELIALENAAAREVGNRRELTIAFARAVLKAAGGGV